MDYLIVSEPDRLSFSGHDSDASEDPSEVAVKVLTSSVFVLLENIQVVFVQTEAFFVHADVFFVKTAKVKPFLNVKISPV